MPTIIQEGRQQLEFDSAWKVLRWDISAEFTGSFEQALHQLTGEGVKAADVAGARVERGQIRTLLVAEFKDFNHPGIPSRQQKTEAERGISDQLTRNVVRKVIDTLCGATFAHDVRDRRSPELDDWRPSLARSTTALLILVCVEVPKSQAAAAGPWTKRLQQRLRWLGPNAQVIVTNRFRAFQGDGISYRA